MDHLQGFDLAGLLHLACDQQFVQNKVRTMKVEDQVQLAHLETITKKVNHDHRLVGHDPSARHKSPVLVVRGDSTYVPKVPVQYFDVAVDDLQCDELIVLWVDSCNKKQTCVSD